MAPDDPHPLQNGDPSTAELAFGHFLVPRRTDGSLWELGRGAMGVTYRAFDTSLQTEVALKVIRSDRVSEDVARRRFQREARSAAKVRHPNIASVLYLGEEGGEFFYAMEFVPGHSLADLLRETNGPLPPAVAVALAAQAAAALNAAHKKELIHRDLKPANLMLLEGEHLDHTDERTRAAGNRLLKIIDFGLARSFAAERHDESLVTQTSSGFIGTPAYASPEQGAGADDLDGRADLYSLGIILWQMLAGQLPFTGRVMKVLSDHQVKPPPLEQLANVPKPLVELLNGSLTKDPAARWPQSAGELRDRLDELLRELASEATPVRSKPAPLPIPAVIERRPPTETTGPISPVLPPAPTRQLPTKIIQPATPLPETDRTAPTVATRRKRRAALVAVVLFLLAIIAAVGISISTRFSRSFAVADTPTATVLPTISLTPQATVSAEQILHTDALRYLEEARTTANAITNDYDKASALRAIAAAQAKAGDLAGARTTASAITNYYDKALALNAIAAAQAKAGDLAGAHETFTQARTTASAITYDSAKSPALSAIAAAQAKAGDLTGARETTAAITDDYAKTYALNAIAVAQAEAGDVTGAKETFAQAKTTANAITNGYNKALALRAIAAAQAKAGDPNAPATFTQASTTAAAITDKQDKASAVGKIAAAQATAGNIIEAETIAATITDVRSKAIVLRCIAVAQARAGDIASASFTAAAIIYDDGDKILALSEVTAAQVRSGDTTRAYDTLTRMKPLAAAITDASNKVFALRAVAVAEAKVEGFPAAEQWVEMLTDPLSRALCYIALAKARLNPTELATDDED